MKTLSVILGVVLVGGLVAVVIWHRTARQVDLKSAEDELRRYIHLDVWGGFVPVDEISSTAVELLQDDYGRRHLIPLATSVLREELEAHKLAQAGWSDLTDCERLDAAFDRLEQSGIVSRQHYSCCGTCGAGEIWDELQDQLAQGRSMRGYVFYHEQDTESAVDNALLYLSYGSAQETPEASVAIGREIIAELERHGLSTHWSEDLEHRIGVDVTWQRRRE